MTSAAPARPPLDLDRLATAPGLQVQVVPAAPSTNALVAERAHERAPEGLVVVAEHQTAGRGRLDRTWQTPDRAALTFSVLLRPAVPAARWPWLPLLTGYAVARALRAEGHDARLKWPNDVLLGPQERKVAGILVERIETPQGPAAVAGVGLNVSTVPEELPIPTATSLLIGSGVEPDRTGLLLAVLESLRDAYVEWLGGDGASLRAAYLSSCVTVGRDVRVELPGGRALVGPATGIDAGGRLVVQGPDGEMAVGAGDVVHVRRAEGDQ
jgi:BirA family biotin operon repressor/biotin-[acetyl-CoA-carboxylase] ligase